MNLIFLHQCHNFRGRPACSYSSRAAWLYSVMLTWFIIVPNIKRKKSIIRLSLDWLDILFIDCFLIFFALIDLFLMIKSRKKSNIYVKCSYTVDKLLDVYLNPSPSEFLKWNNPVSIFGTVHYHDLAYTLGKW